MTKQLADKAALVLTLLCDHDYLVPQTNVRIANTSRKMLVDLINAWRMKRRVNVQMHASNLATYLNHPDEAPLNFLTELTNALGLGDLGFDELFWKSPIDKIPELVQAAFAGGVLTCILDHPVNGSLFEIRPTIIKG